jgi:hypothetical protein
VKTDAYWENRVASFVRALHRYTGVLGVADLEWCCAEAGVHGHLAVVAEPYLSAIIAGRKTIESRWSKRRTPPFGRVQPGDLLLLKEVSGPLRAVVAVVRVEAYGPLLPGAAAQIMDRHRAELALEDPFRELKRDNAFGTLMFLAAVQCVGPLPVAKQDRRGWVELRSLPFRLV